METLFYNGGHTTNKTPKCPEVWPKEWKPCERGVQIQPPSNFLQLTPQIKYSIYVDWTFYNNKSTNVYCKDYVDAKDHIGRYGMAAEIRTAYRTDTLDFLKWLVLNNKLPKGFEVAILNRNHYAESETKLALNLAKNINGYIAIRDERLLEKL